MNGVMTRRDALAALGGSFAALGIPNAIAAEPLTLVRVSMAPFYAVAPHYAADAQGYFAAEGIAVTNQAIQGGVVGIPGLVSGSFDILNSNSISVLTAMERGIDLRIIAEGVAIPSKPPDADALFKRKGEPIASGKDLEGKIIGVNTRFDAMWLVMQGWVKKTGGDLDKITYREVPMPAMIDALKTRQVDVALVLDPFMTVGFADPALELVAWPSSAVLPGAPSAFWVVTGTTAETKPDMIRSYLRGFRKGVAWINGNLGDQAYLDLVAGYTKVDPKLLAKMYTAPQPTEIHVDAINNLAAFMREFGLLKAPADIRPKVFS